jgi:DNA-binding transcriptional LysR family regulator
VLERDGAFEDPAERDFIAWGPEVTGVAAAEWLAEHVPADRIGYRASSLLNQRTAACEGMGYVLLPCYLGDREPALSRAIPAPIPELTRELWIVTHADLRQTARIRAFFEVVGGALAQKAALFRGA